MRKIYIISIALASFALSGCDLTLLPEDEIAPGNFFKNESDLQLWTNQFYTMLDNADTNAAQNADDMVDRQLGAVIEGTRSAADESGWTWTHLRNINYFLENSSNCEDETVRKKYDGVAYFFRAYFYFVKVRRYGDVPYYSQVIGSMDKELLSKPRDDRGFVMDKVMEDLDKAIEMLPEAKSVSTVTKWTALALKSRAALYEGTWRAYRNLPDADKYLKLAAEAAEEFIDTSGYTLFSEGQEPYRNLFNCDEARASEVVLARIYNASLNLTTTVQFAISNNQQGFTRRYMNHYLMKDGTRFTDKPGYETMFYTDETQDRDPRLSQTVLCPGYIQKGETDVSPNTLLAMTGYQPIKFVAETAYGGASKGQSDWPLFRAAEVYLNFAEAKAELGTLTQGDIDKSIKKLRDRAGMPNLDKDEANANPDPFLAACYPNVTQSANTGAILEIRRERTIEMVMEGNRQWDMLRWKEGAQIVNRPNPYYGCYIPGPGKYDMDLDGKPDLELYLIEDSKDNTIATKKKIGVDIILSGNAANTSGYITAWLIGYEWNESRDYLWPIPADQRVLTAGSLSQNPGWTDSTDFN